MPGVVEVTSTTRSGPSLPLKPQSGQWFVAGQAERGRTDEPTVMNGMADYDLYFGSRVTYGSLYDAIKCYFDNGGSLVQAIRVVGASSTSGTLEVDDESSVPTLQFDAVSPGAWSSNLQVAILAGLLPNTFRVQLILNGTVVEDYTNLASPSQAVTVMSNSAFVKVTDLGSSTAAPGNNPDVAAATALSAGDDKRSAIVDADYITAVNKFSGDLGVGAVSVPGMGATVHSGLVAHAKATNRIAILATSRGATKNDLITLSGTQQSEFAGLFAPWVIVADGAGGQRAIPPEGYVAGSRAKAAYTGPWVVPAGANSIANSSMLDIDQTFTTDDSNDLDTAHISMIRRIQGTIRLYGWRSMSPDVTNYQLLSVRDLLNSIVFDCQSAAEEFVFDPVDSQGQLLSRFNAALVGVVDPIASAGGLYGLNDAEGKPLDPGYLVDTGPSVNTPATLATNTIAAIVSVRPGPSAATVRVQIVRVGFTAAL